MANTQPLSCMNWFLYILYKDNGSARVSWLSRVTAIQLMCFMRARVRVVYGDVNVWLHGEFATKYVHCIGIGLM